MHDIAPQESGPAGAVPRDPINAFWHGPPMPPHLRACLQSFTRTGRAVRLFLYDRSLVPSMTGVDFVDAREVMPIDQARAYVLEGSFSLAANRFRLELMRRGLGIWVDVDTFCLRDIDDAEPHLFGRQSPGSINNAVLRLPPGSPVIAEMLACFEPRAPVPPWFSGRRRLRVHLRRLVGLRCDAEHWHWGATGPAALTWLARKHGIDRHASPVERFYPLPLSMAERLAQADFDPTPWITPRTDTIHIWNQRLRNVAPTIERGSPLWRLTEHGELV